MATRKTTKTTPSTTEPEAGDLAGKKVAELRAIASERGIKLPKGIRKKAKLIAAIEAGPVADDDQVPTDEAEPKAKGKKVLLPFSHTPPSGLHCVYEIGDPIPKTLSKAETKRLKGLGCI